MSGHNPNANDASPGAPSTTEIGLPELAWRIASDLPQNVRRQLALRLIEAEADEITFRREGTVWTAFPWDRIISGALFIEGNFQRQEVRAVLGWMGRHQRLAAPRDVIIDIGANIGTSTIPFAQETDCRVLAIEPIPEVFALLCRNVADNRLSDRIVTIQTAVCATGGDRVRMILPSGNSGAGEVAHPNQPPTFAGHYSIRREMEVGATGLAKLLDLHGVAPERVAFVWSDTQGCEADVMETGPSLWAAGVPLFAELDPKTWRGSSGLEAILAAAAKYFSGFIAAETLIADADPEIRPVAELAAYCRALGTGISDVLLLPARSASAIAGT
jgi:FkbM family methyltransferase